MDSNIEGYESTSNLSKTEIEGKVTHTKFLLSGEKTIEKESIFIFSKKVASQAKRWFDRQSRTGGELKDCKVCSVSDFATIIKSISDFPYEPIHKAEDIKNSIQQYEKKAEWKRLFAQVKYWCTKAEEYRYKNHSESQHITDVIKEIWKDFNQKKYIFTEEELWEIEFLKEDFSCLNK